MGMAEMPTLIPVRQHLWSKRVQDIEGTVSGLVRRSTLAARIRPGTRVAIAVGSRGVANIAQIAAAVVQSVRVLGGDPFIVPAMGSHGGGTAAGQIEILAGLGVTEKRVGAPIVSSMDVATIGGTDDGMPVYFDRNAFGADAVIVINRVKKHTDITAPFESGLFKMMAIGLGKKAQADLIHAYGAPGLRKYIPEVARVMLAKAPIALGIATIENGLEETAEVHAFEPSEIEQRERQLLSRNKRLLPRLPFDAIDILIVDRMGKEISGTGMDTNVLGRVMIAGERELKRPRIQHVIVLDLTPASHGNAIGIGLADITTDALVAKIDREVTYINGITSGFFDRAKIPITVKSDREALHVALSRLSPERRARPAIARIHDTLHLAEFLVSASLLARATAPLEITGAEFPIEFDAAGRILTAASSHAQHVVQETVLV